MAWSIIYRDFYKYRKRTGLSVAVALFPCLALPSLGQEPTSVADQHYVELSKAECGTLSECARRGYRLVHSALPFLLLEKEAGPPNTYRYLETPRIEPCDNAKYPQQMLNQAGTFGYRLVSRNDLATGGIMEKPPGRPNQYQYIAVMPRQRMFESGEGYTSRLNRLTQEMWHQGFIVRSLLCGQRFLVERAAEPLEQGAEGAGTEFDVSQPYISVEAERSKLNDAGSLGYRAFFYGGNSRPRVLLGKMPSSNSPIYQYEVISFRDGATSVQAALDDAGVRGFRLVPVNPGCDKLLLERVSANQTRYYRYLLIHEDPGSLASLLVEMNRVYGQGYQVVGFGLAVFGRQSPTVRRFAVMEKLEPLS